jgi:hypothetical protein
MCSMFLVITGAALEVVGLALVFIELAIIRSHELGIPPPWSPLTARIRRMLKRPQVVQLEAATETARAGHVRVYQRPAKLADEPTDHERLERLERYVRDIDSDLDGLWESIGQHSQEAVREALRNDEKLREEIARREDEQREKLRPSLRRQATGATLVLAGLVLGTIGNLV